MKVLDPLTATLLLTCAMLGVVLAVEVLGPARGTVPPPAAASGKSQSPTVVWDDFKLPPLSKFRDIVERPLFVQNRRPIPPETASKSKSPKAQNARSDEYALAAVVMAPDARFALVRASSDKKLHRLEEGQEIQGWKLKELTMDAATLARDSEEQLLPLVRKTPEYAKKEAQRMAIRRKAQEQAPPADKAATRPKAQEETPPSDKAAEKPPPEDPDAPREPPPSNPE